MAHGMVQRPLCAAVSPVSYTRCLRHLACCDVCQPGCDRGCRRPKTKYEIGTTPAELTTATTGAHSHFEPRIWLAGRRLMSMRAATLRMPSATATVMISLRVLSSRSLHVRLAAMTSSPYVAGSVMAERYIVRGGPTLSRARPWPERGERGEMLSRMMRWPVMSVLIMAGLVVALAAGASGSARPGPGAGLGRRGLLVMAVRACRPRACRPWTGPRCPVPTGGPTLTFSLPCPAPRRPHARPWVSTTPAAPYGT